MKKIPKGLKENIEIAKTGGNVAKVAKDKLEENLNEKVVTKYNKLNYNLTEIKETIINY